MQNRNFPGPPSSPQFGKSIRNSSIRFVFRGPRGLHLASQVGPDVLSERGNAIEALIAPAAAIAIVYPHMDGSQEPLCSSLRT
jgi:hypothetical protein